MRVIGRPGVVWLALAALAAALAPFQPVFAACCRFAAVGADLRVRPRLGAQMGAPLQNFATTSLWNEAGASLARAQDQAADLKARLERESDPIRKARLELRLAELALNEATRLYEKGDTEKGLARLEEMLSFVVAAYDRLQATGRDPRKRPGGFKETEIKMREFSRRVEDLRVSLPSEEREGIEKIAARLVELREHLLHRLMRVKEPKK